MKWIAPSLLLFALTACGGEQTDDQQQEDTEQEQGTADRILDEVTGKRAIDQGETLKQQVKDIRRQQRKQLEEAQQ